MSWELDRQPIEIIARSDGAQGASPGGHLRPEQEMAQSGWLGRGVQWDLGRRGDMEGLR